MYTINGQGPETGFEQELCLVASPGVDLGPALEIAIARWQNEFPGVSATQTEEASAGTYSDQKVSTILTENCPTPYMICEINGLNIESLDDSD